MTRLSWEADAPESADRRRALPAGEYKLIGIRLNAKDEKGDRWDLSASHQELRKITVKPGDTQLIKVNETIRIRHQLRPQMVGFDISMEQKAGTTIYRNGKRTSMSYELQDKEGKTRFEGPLNYG